MSFKVGDVVKLKSSGPEMTVSEPGRLVIGGVPVEGRKPAKVFCKWFEEGDESKPRTASFNPEELEHYNEQEQSGDLGYK